MMKVGDKEQMVHCRFKDSEIRTRVHAGTHVDAPSAFLNGGMEIDQISVNALMGIAGEKPGITTIQNGLFFDSSLLGWDAEGILCGD